MRKLATTLSVLTLAGGMGLAGGGVALADSSQTHCTTTSANGTSTTDCTTTTNRDGQCAARDAINVLTCVPVLNNVNVLNNLGDRSNSA
ncbi:MAG: hypothetical protein ACRDQU_13110 [Pseudonocardiaceae bacterium]